MADNYLLFSQIIPALNPQEQAWVTQVLAADPEPDLAALGLPADALEFDLWPSFEWELQQSNNDLWLYSLDNGNVEHLAAFVKTFLARFRPSDRFELTWADTCSRPRTGEFGGGGLVVTAQSVRRWSAHEWVSAQHPPGPT